MGTDVGRFWARLMSRLWVLSAALLLMILLAACTHSGPMQSTAESAHALLPQLRLVDIADPAPFIAPLDQAVYPFDLAAPLFRWQGDPTGRWLIRVASQDRSKRLFLMASRNPWVPSMADWEEIKSLAPGEWLTMTRFRIQGATATAEGRTRFSVSRDPLAAKIIYQEMPVPFKFAVENVSLFRWRSYDPSAYGEPPTILTGLPYCAACHTFSSDGRFFGLDMDYRGDRGGYALAPVAKSMELKRSDVLSWNRIDTAGEQVSRGLFTRISAAGDYAVASVRERPFLVRIDDAAYSQLFFPLSGTLAYYSRKDGRVMDLPGADDPAVAQVGPTWSPDGETIVFSRGEASPALWEALGEQKFMDAHPGEDIHALNQKYRMHFDLWQVPFNQGAGGLAAPITGASGNGKSNYFPRFTPDGRWLVFCQSDTGLVSQPSSRLMIVPSDGGPARALRCNRRELNSYHSIAPSGRWMVFSSKPDEGRLTRVFLTYLDENGVSSPAIQLHRIGTPGFAAILPEAVGLTDRVLQSVRLIEP